MKSIEVIVPKLLVKKHYPHPEFYGESIVELKNGMITDIYTNENGYLFTITNEENLIKYLKSHIVQDHEVVSKLQEVFIRSMNNNDLSTLFDWFNQKTNYSYNDLGLDIDSIRTYISHSLTMYSHGFMILIDNVEVGLIGFSVIDGVAITNLEIYEKNRITCSEIDKTYNLIIEYIVKNYGTSEFQTIIFSEDEYTKKILTRNGFSFIRDDYEFNVSFEDVKKGSLYKKKIIL